MHEVLPEAEENKAPRGSTDIAKLNMCGFPQIRVPLPCGDVEDEPLAGGTDEGSGRGYREWGREGDDMPPMNSRGGLSLMNPKAFIG